MQGIEAFGGVSVSPERAEDRWTVPKALYAVLTGTLLLGFFYVMLTYRESYMFDGGVYSLPVFIWVLRLVSVGMTLVMGKVWKDKGFWILMAYLMLLVIRLLLENSIRLFALSVSEHLLCGMWVYIACYGVSRVLSYRQLKQAAAVFAALWTAGMVILSSVGLYAYWTNRIILNLTGTSFFGVWYYRLTLCYYLTGSAATSSLSMGIAMIAFFSVKRKWAKALYAAAWVIMMITLSLSSTRTAFITTGINLGAAAAIGILHRFYTGRKAGEEAPGRRKTVMVWMTAVGAAGALLAAAMIGLMGLIPVINAVKTRGGLISAALAEAPAGWSEVATRSYTEVGLNGRVEAWTTILSTLKNNPILLLTGASIFFPMEGLGLELQHSHCRMLMTLLESGIPGLALYLLFYGYIFRCSLRLVKSGDVPRWILLLPAVAGGLVVGDLVECLTWLRAGTYLMLPFLFVACGIISTYGDRKEVERG